MKYKLLKKLAPESYRQRLEEYLLSPMFPWYWQGYTIDYKDDDKTKTPLHSGVFQTDCVKDSNQLVHTFLINGTVNSDHYKLIEPLIILLENQTGCSYRAHRVKANLLLQDEHFGGDFFHPPHADRVDEHISLLYYVNDSDGDTIFFNERVDENPTDLTESNRFTPISGDAVIFDSRIYHCSRPPQESRRRIVINFILKQL